jgi:hypothetical protein
MIFRGKNVLRVFMDYYLEISKELLRIAYYMPDAH